MPFSHFSRFSFPLLSLGLFSELLSVQTENVVLHDKAQHLNS